jgi:hypothetical protein
MNAMQSMLRFLKITWKNNPNIFKIDRRKTFSVDGLDAKNTLPGLRIKNNAVPGLKKNAGF